MPEAASPPDSPGVAERTPILTSAERGARARRLHAALGDLTVVVEGCEVECGAVVVPSYPDDARPTSTVRMRGRGVVGTGEHVGWTTRTHLDFCAHAPAAVPVGRASVGELSAALRASVEAPYDRAALEAALIDLALRQNGHTLFDLAGVAPAEVRYVLSFAPLRDPASEISAVLERERVREGDLELKLDVDPDWGDAALAALAARASDVAVLDFKGAGTIAAAARIARAVPAPLLEDPPDPAALLRAHPDVALASRLSVDAALTQSARVARLDPQPFAANVKPARMGGVLEAVATVAECAARDIAVYFGGMWEVGVGRALLLRLASVLSPDGPNDIAPLATETPTARRPRRLDPMSG